MKPTLLLLVLLPLAFAVCPNLNDYIKDGTLQGLYVTNWLPLADAQWDNCVNTSHNDSGIASAFHHGCLTVVTWCGKKNATVPWQRNTLTQGFSLTKAVSSFAPVKLIEDGYADYDDPVSCFWPEIATRGKDNITVGMVMSHAAALADLATPEHPFPSFNYSHICIDCDPSYMENLVLEKYMDWPSSPTNYTCGYHVNDYGWVLDPCVRRIDPLGRHITAYINERFASPLGIELHYGIRPNETDLHDRVAVLTAGNSHFRNSSAFRQLIPNLGNNATRQYAGLFTPVESRDYYWFAFNQPALRNARWEGGVIYSTAEDLAQLFSLWANHGKTAAGTRYFKHGSISAAAEPVFDGIDQMNFEHTIYTRAGWYRNDGARYNLLSDTAFAKTGAGGQLAVIEPRKKANFVYLTSVMESDTDESAFKDTARKILAAFYSILDSEPNEP